MTSIVTDERQRLIDELTSDMTRGDLIAVLEDLRFQGSSCAPCGSTGVFATIYWRPCADADPIRA